MNAVFLWCCRAFSALSLVLLGFRRNSIYIGFRLKYDGPSRWEDGVVYILFARFEEQAAEHRLHAETVPVWQVNHVGRHVCDCKESNKIEMAANSVEGVGIEKSFNLWVRA